MTYAGFVVYLSVMSNLFVGTLCRREFLRTTLLAIPAPSITSAQTGGDERATWLRAYRDWLRSVMPEQLPKGKDPLPALSDLYQERLKAVGLTAAQAAERWNYVNQHVADEPEIARLRTNLRYASGWYEGEPPSGALRDFVQGRAPGQAVDCGMGSGRNALLLAALGWRVTGMDMSDTAVEQARARAVKAGVSLEAVRSTYRDFAWGKERWDLIVNVDSQDGFDGPNWPASSTFFTAPLQEALRAGGFLYIESHVGNDGRNRLDGIGKLFQNLRVVREEVISDATWDERGKLPDSERWKWPGTARIAVFIAQKPLRLAQ